MSLSRVNSQFFDEHEHEHKSWVLVKRQKINILIPPSSPPDAAQFTVLKPLKSRNIQTRKGNVVKRSLPVVNFQFGITRMRFLNFEQRIKEHGGIRKWLISNGFQRFLPVLEREKISMHQLFVISMETLKTMGVTPVGPRRKLIYAIEKLSQPR
ncbi:Sterile alpha motif (SAM) domain-containing protein [Rhynchospora pubera]|uniref:Sterile alpha motif (SAM) domain-containing protein n=1 Tax=Rhynchospora pubera TaxID=906938 RepID=A0AAV8HVR0_9POAL|nr:Sterile alpha motif (SAM) domain-containing protein [Rhynchospora pubera]